MIFDKIENYHKYNLPPLVIKALEHSKAFSSSASAGRTDVSGEKLYAIVMDYVTKPSQDCMTEAHRKYIDVQILLDGEETLIWYPEGKLPVSLPYCAERDAEFYSVENAKPGALLRLLPGFFAVFFPWDIHTAQAEADNAMQVKKLVYKVSVSG